MFLAARITKPAYPATLVDRPRLHRRLDRWAEQRAIAIFAPTGYGKSSLVSRWLDVAGLAAHTAWLNLDESDSDPRQFALHLAAALDRVLPGALALAQPILEDRNGTVRRVLARIFYTYWDGAGPDALPAGRHTLLVLDDLHRVQSPEVDAAIAAILEQGPERLHLLLLARQRTTLPLARLVAHGQVMALTADDLRFSSAEVKEYVQRQGFREPTEAEAAQVVERSEGWAAALQLAVLALPGRGSAAELVNVLHGESVWLAAYLTDEVLDRQTPELRRFLLQTSILDEFTPALCAAVTGDEHAYARIDEIGRGNLFLVAMEERAKRYRYHHLFQELLQHRLLAETPAGHVAELHQRAAAWLAAAGEIEAAVRHFLAGGASEQAAALVESQMRAALLHDLFRAGALLALLPGDVLAQRPQLLLDRCRVAVLVGDKMALAYAREAEVCLQAQRLPDRDAARLEAEWLVLNACGLFIQRDLAAAMDVALQAHTVRAFLDDFHFGTLHFLLMQLHSFAGRGAEMAPCAEAALEAFLRSDFTLGALAVRREMARWSMAHGDSAQASRQFRDLFREWPRDLHLGADDLALAYFRAAENSYWQDQMDEGNRYTRSFMELAIQLQDGPLTVLAWYLGRTVGADAAVDGAEPPEADGPLGESTRPGVADFLLDYKVRFLISSGRSDLAWHLAQDSGINLQSLPPHPVHRKLITYLRAAVAQDVDPAAVAQALSAAQNAAVQSGDRFSQLQLLALAASQQLRLGDAAAAETLMEAAHLATETGYVRVILEVPGFASILQEMGVSLAEAPTSAAGATPSAAQTIGLTEQEQRVLELLAADYSYEQIAAELVVSVNTVRTHVRHLYRKLSANRRDQAVAQAVRRGLLPGVL